MCFVSSIILDLPRVFISTKTGRQTELIMSTVIVQASNMSSIVCATGVQMDRRQYVLHQRRSGLLSFWRRKVSCFSYTLHDRNPMFRCRRSSFDPLSDHLLSCPSGEFGLWLDGDLYHGRSHSCKTFGNPMLSKKEDFYVQDIEIWAFE